MQMEKLKQKLDYLNEKQLQDVVALMTSLEPKVRRSSASESFCWHREDYIKRTQGLKQWMGSLPSIQEESIVDVVSKPSKLCA
ncbi:MAG: hypothetical protein AAGH78_15515 [Cyanobacteria bacterium P01_H01_bin.58]